MRAELDGAHKKASGGNPATEPREAYGVRRLAGAFCCKEMPCEMRRQRTPPYASRYLPRAPAKESGCSRIFVRFHHDSLRACRSSGCAVEAGPARHRPGVTQDRDYEPGTNYPKRTERKGLPGSCQSDWPEDNFGRKHPGE